MSIGDAIVVCVILTLLLFLGIIVYNKVQDRKEMGGEK